MNASTVHPNLYSSSNAVGSPQMPVIPGVPTAGDEEDSIPRGSPGELVPNLYAKLGGLNAEQTLVVETAFYLKVKRCMEESGFTLMGDPPVLDERRPSAILFDARIGVLDVDYARMYGYQLNLSSVEGPPVDPESLTIKYPSEEYLQALKGNGEDGQGCQGEATTAIDEGRGSEEESTPLLGQIYEDSVAATYVDPRYKRVVELWASCMREAGFDYEDPTDLSKSLMDSGSQRVIPMRRRIRRSQRLKLPLRMQPVKAPVIFLRFTGLCSGGISLPWQRRTVRCCRSWTKAGANSCATLSESLRSSPKPSSHGSQCVGAQGSCYETDRSRVEVW